MTNQQPNSQSAKPPHHCPHTTARPRTPRQTANTNKQTNKQQHHHNQQRPFTFRSHELDRLASMQTQQAPRSRLPRPLPTFPRPLLTSLPQPFQPNMNPDTKSTKSTELSIVSTAGWIALKAALDGENVDYKVDRLLENGAVHIVFESEAAALKAHAVLSRGCTTRFHASPRLKALVLRGSSADPALPPQAPLPTQATQATHATTRSRTRLRRRSLSDPARPTWLDSQHTQSQQQVDHPTPQQHPPQHGDFDMSHATCLLQQSFDLHGTRRTQQTQRLTQQWGDRFDGRHPSAAFGPRQPPHPQSWSWGNAGPHNAPPSEREPQASGPNGHMPQPLARYPQPPPQPTQQAPPCNAPYALCASNIPPSNYDAFMASMRQAGACCVEHIVTNTMTGYCSATVRFPTKELASHALQNFGAYFRSTACGSHATPRLNPNEAFQVHIKNLPACCQAELSARVNNLNGVIMCPPAPEVTYAATAGFHTHTDACQAVAAFNTTHLGGRHLEAEPNHLEGRFVHMDEAAETTFASFSGVTIDSGEISRDLLGGDEAGEYDYSD
ncbi:hypothetical protein PTSG_02670 [Salpingoeca rosetta]|uniref:Uncharacterized protein n=1 Tax=Salpingoeca rosetta (strain ATCC 50818 / BSB-021) TaxID=946362 RepID=F2U2Z0_SALR5|nr:uncharacterized protein PTSG_02670 [Salpingoeca rosetta]EGD81984.1 hypothetical protein PTSG_02670 [Salpingoeca rosetta]|eukprot:XP_004996167.1 hypothetical protein PTSG_02670 [Salpingoeca rosetta]